MMLLNHVSRYDVAEVALRGAAVHNKKVELDLTKHLGELKHRVKKIKEFILREGMDPEDTYDVPKFEGLGVKKGSDKHRGGETMYEG